MRWLFIVITVLLMSCSHSLDDMVENYNGAFSSEEEEETEEEKKADFAESDMLYEKYFVADNETLNLSAPSGCSECSWTLTDPTDSSKGENFATLFEGSGIGYSEKRFVLYVPNSNLETGKTYKLVLSVSLNGNTYTDTCAVVIYAALENL